MKNQNEVLAQMKKEHADLTTQLEKMRAEFEESHDPKLMDSINYISRKRRKLHVKIQKKKGRMIQAAKQVQPRRTGGTPSGSIYRDTPDAHKRPMQGGKVSPK